ncbi:YjdF family protein [Arabiibacter massiliensis]|uniref:YjdF family protein n=1 Tax=Arabiibacter massiliensis TaxID=1870985 RepID=UPI0009B9B2D9|nr:YjdF family protein [Arabiibacter massiliensis]
MQVITSSTLTVLHDGQFWVGICEHTDAEEGRYGACRVVFGAVEPADTEMLAFVCARWASLPFAQVEAEEAGAAPSHANPKRRQREARRQVERAGLGTKAQQAMSAAYEERKQERKAGARDAREAEAERQYALKQQKRKQKHLGH